MPSQKKVLLVEDEKDIVTVLKSFLSDSGYTVAAAYDGEEALTKANEFKPHLVLLDVRLPRLDGLEVCKALRRNRAFDRVPVIILTALGEMSTTEEALRAGADDFLSKPFTNERLIQKIEKLLRTSES